ncbi:hypothetical protein QTP88_013602 [Uroleucon formosanum]
MSTEVKVLNENYEVYIEKNQNHLVADKGVSKMLMNKNDQVRDIEINNSELNGKLDDPSYWASIIYNDILAAIVTLGPIQINNYDFFQNDEKPARRFTEKYYYRLMPNGAKTYSVFMSTPLQRFEPPPPDVSRFAFYRE